MKWRQHALGYVFTNLRFDTLKQKKMYSNSDLIIAELRPTLRTNLTKNHDFWLLSITHLQTIQAHQKVLIYGLFALFLQTFFAEHLNQNVFLNCTLREMILQPLTAPATQKEPRYPSDINRWRSFSNESKLRLLWISGKFSRTRTWNFSLRLNLLP